MPTPHEDHRGFRGRRLAAGILFGLVPVALHVGGCVEDEGPSGPKWTVVASGMSAALFSVDGTSANDVWIVGADERNELGPAIRHWDGSAWTRHDSTLRDEDLTWIHVFDAEDAYVAGTNGSILARRGGTFEAMDTPSEQTVWGVWGTDPEHAWAVGGEAGGGRGFVWRFDGERWTAVDLDATLPAPTAWFKVWGSSADDVWFCGTDGSLMHWNGTEFAAVSSGTSRTLLTVNGSADGRSVTAVGGAFEATIVESLDGSGWREVTPAGDAPLQTFGVRYGVDGEAWAVGMAASALHRDDAGWHVDPATPDVSDDLHGVWIDPDGGVWAVGGQIIAHPLIDGTLLYRGTDPPAPLDE